MKSSILRSFDADGEGLSLKGLRKAALATLMAEDSEGSDKKTLKEQFESCLSSLVEKGKVIEEDGVYTKAAKSSKKRKTEEEVDDEPATKVTKTKNMKADRSQDEDEELKIKAVKDSAAAAAAYSSYSAASANSKMDLSKFGEQAWKDGKNEELGIIV